MYVTVAAAATKFIGYSGICCLLRRLLYSILFHSLFLAASLFQFVRWMQAVLASYTINCTLYDDTNDVVRPFVDNSRCVYVVYALISLLFFFFSLAKYTNYHRFFVPFAEPISKWKRRRPVNYYYCVCRSYNVIYSNNTRRRQEIIIIIIKNVKYGAARKTKKNALAGMMV